MEMTFKEHQELGAKLKKLDDVLMHSLSTDFKGNKTKGRASHQAKAEKALSDLRNHLEEIMDMDHPGKTNQEVLSVYYGARERPSWEK